MNIIKIPTLFFALLVAFSARANTKVAETFLKDLIQFSKMSFDQKGKASPESDALLKVLKERTQFSMFSSRALGGLGAKASAAERARFEKLIEQLVELAAFPKARFISAEEQSLAYKPQGKGRVQVTGKMKREKGGDLIVTDFSIVLIMDAKSRVYDVVLEDELLSANVSRQLKKNLQKKTFADLLGMMEKRVAKLKNPQSTEGV